MERQERVLGDDELAAIYAGYMDLRRLFPDHPIIIDQDGVVRWKINTAVDWAFDNGLDLNAMKVAYVRGKIARDDYMSFFRQLGYSLSGYWDVFGDELAEMMDDG